MADGAARRRLRSHSQDGCGPAWHQGCDPELRRARSRPRAASACSSSPATASSRAARTTCCRSAGDRKRSRRSRPGGHRRRGGRRHGGRPQRAQHRRARRVPRQSAVAPAQPAGCRASTRSSSLFVSFATSPGAVALDGEGRNSPYTKHLAQAIGTANSPGGNVQAHTERRLPGDRRQADAVDLLVVLRRFHIPAGAAPPAARGRRSITAQRPSRANVPAAGPAPRRCWPASIAPTAPIRTAAAIAAWRRSRRMATVPFHLVDRAAGLHRHRAIRRTDAGGELGSEESGRLHVRPAAAASMANGRTAARPTSSAVRARGARRGQRRPRALQCRGAAIPNGSRYPGAVSIVAAGRPLRSTGASARAAIAGAEPSTAMCSPSTGAARRRWSIRLAPTARLRGLWATGPRRENTRTAR